MTVHDIELCNHIPLLCMYIPKIQYDWSPDYSASGQPHPKEIPGRNILKNPDGFWDLYVTNIHQLVACHFTFFHA